jgi:hypothetical protein
MLALNAQRHANPHVSALQLPTSALVGSDLRAWHRSWPDYRLTGTNRFERETSFSLSPKFAKETVVPDQGFPFPFWERIWTICVVQSRSEAWVGDI